jgi:hypothetical protein
VKTVKTGGDGFAALLESALANVEGTLAKLGLPLDSVVKANM